MRVADKSIIVTGAGGGIGEGIARRLAAEGARVIVNDLQAALGEKVAGEITTAGGQARFVQADVTKGADWATLVQLQNQQIELLQQLLQRQSSRD